MQVDLFKNDAVLAESFRLRKQMETRGFQLDFPVDGILKELADYPMDLVQPVLNELRNLATQQRTYDFIDDAGCDNLWKLEALGLGKYSREYTVIIDLSEALDLLMELEFGCCREECRQIPNYQEVSRRLMNFDFEGASEKFGVLFFESEMMTKAYLRLFEEIESSAAAINYSQDEKMSRFVFKFYSRILQKASAVKDYVVCDLQRQYPGCMIYRSKNFSSAILTSDMRLDDELVLRLPSGNDYKLKLHQYRRYEWIREGIVDELGREIRKR